MPKQHIARTYRDLESLAYMLIQPRHA